jgi:hypothetical protein
MLEKLHRLSSGLRHAAPAAVALLIMGCNHSTACCDALVGTTGAFDGTTVPIRLTYSSGSDQWPAFSWDGKSVTYRYERLTGDRDYCSASLPAAGGNQEFNICALGLNEADSANQIASLTQLDDQTIAFTHHESFTGALGAQAAGLYIARLDSPRDAQLVLPLLTTPTGATSRYDALLTPVRTGPRELIALGAEMIVGPTIAFGPTDTVYLGVELVRIDLESSPARVTPIASATGANGWAYDPSTGMAYFNRPTYIPLNSNTLYQPIADSLFSVVVTSGAVELLWVRPSLDPAPWPFSLEAVDGLAAGGGKVFVSYHSDSPGPGSRSGTTTIGELISDGEIRVIATYSGTESAGPNWGRLAASPDGNRLVAEGNSGPGQIDLYLFDNP